MEVVALTVKIDFKYTFGHIKTNGYAFVDVELIDNLFEKVSTVQLDEVNFFIDGEACIIDTEYSEMLEDTIKQEYTAKYFNKTLQQIVATV